MLRITIPWHYCHWDYVFRIRDYEVLSWVIAVMERRSSTLNSVLIRVISYFLFLNWGVQCLVFLLGN